MLPRLIIIKNSTPMRMANEGDMPGDVWRLYDFITRSFIGSISPGLKYTTTNVTFAIGNEKFDCQGTKVTSPGFTSVMHWLAKKKLEKKKVGPQY